MTAPQPQDYDNRKSWNGRPTLARALRISVFVTPIVAAVLATTALGHLFFQGSWPTAIRLLWMVAMFVVATLVSGVVGKRARRLLPLSALCQLNLEFPDVAPSRVKMALRAGNTANAERVIEQFHEQGLADDPQAAAEQVLELIEALKTHDRKTRGHTDKVRALTDVIAQEMGLPNEERNRLRWAAMLHDIGKLSVPAEILNKPGKPNAEEWTILQGHPMAGFDRMGPLRSWLGDASRAVEEHHERWDGTGYPQKLKGEDISLAGRIVAIADSFEVMTATRSYKKPMSYEDARAELVKCAGTHFDPQIVRAMLAVGTRKLSVSAGFLSSILNRLASGNGTVADVVQTVASSGSAGVAVAAPLVRAVQVMTGAAPEGGGFFATGTVIAAKAAPRAVNRIIKVTATTIAVTTSTAATTIPNQLPLREPTTTIASAPTVGTLPPPTTAVTTPELKPTTEPKFEEPPGTTEATNETTPATFASTATVETAPPTLATTTPSVVAAIPTTSRPTTTAAPSTITTTEVPTTEEPTTTDLPTSTTIEPLVFTPPVPLATTTTVASTTTAPLITTTTAAPATSTTSTSTTSTSTTSTSTTSTTTTTTSTTTSTTVAPTTTTTIPACTGWLAEYFTSSTNEPAPGAVPDVTRCYAILDQQQLPPKITGNGYVRFSTTINFSNAAVQTFEVLNNGAYKLLVNGQMVSQRTEADLGSISYNRADVLRVSGPVPVLFANVYTASDNPTVSVELPTGNTGGPQSPSLSGPGAPLTAFCTGNRWLLAYWGGGNVATGCKTFNSGPGGQHYISVATDPFNGNPSPVGTDVYDMRLARQITFSVGGGLVAIDFDADDEVTIWINGELATNTVGYRSAIGGHTQLWMPGGKVEVIITSHNYVAQGNTSVTLTPIP